MKRNDCDEFPDTVIIGSSALYPLAKGAIQMLILLLLLLLLPGSNAEKDTSTQSLCTSISKTIELKQ